MSRKTGLPEALVLSSAAETAAAFREVWALEQSHLPIDAAVKEVIDTQFKIVPLGHGLTFLRRSRRFGRGQSA